MPNYIGRQFGNYSITRLLGEGGFAQVYLGEHVYLHTQVAIKVLSGEMQEQDRQNFLQESRIIAGLRHPSIVRVLDFGIAHDQTPYLVMTYAPNGTLRQRHADTTVVPIDTIVSYIHQVAAALDYAHERRLIHRDVKPENMLLGRNNEVLLSDFGIAVLAHSTRSQNEEIAAGTLAYMAPEQLQGRPKPASDQYALGIVTYEWLCGYKPFAGSGFYNMAAQHLQSPVPSLHKHVPSIPDAIDAVVIRALAKTPGERFPTVVDFATALEHACMSTSWHVASSHLSSSARSNDWQDVRTESTLEAVLPVAKAPSYTTVPIQTDRVVEQIADTSPHRRISRRTATLALTGILGLGAVGGIIWFTRKATSSASGAKSPSASQGKTSTAPSIVSLPNQAVGTTLATYSKHSDVITGVTWSPDGRWIASSSYDKTVQVWSPVPHTTDSPFIYKGHSDKVLAVRWSPNGRFVASSGADTTVHVWNAPSAEKGSDVGSDLIVYRGHTTRVVALAWSPDSGRIASTVDPSGGTPMMHIWDAQTGKHVMAYADPTQSGPSLTHQPFGAVAWSPDAQSIVSSIVTVSIWNVASGGRIIYTGQGYDTKHGLAWSPDSQRIASASDDKTVEVWNAKTTNSFFTYTGHTDAVNAVAWSSDGKYLASASSDQTVQVWDATNGKTLLIYKGHSASVNALAWSPDGRHIVSGGDDRRILVWQAV